MKIGLTGGIATGKSTVSEFLKKLGAIVIDVDEISKEIAKREDVLGEIREEFGEEIVANGNLNREHIRKIVFNNFAKRKTLNSIMHPKILNEVKKRAERSKQNAEIVFINMPLLFEVNFDKEVSKTVVVICEQSKQIERLRKRDKISKEESLKIIDAQMDLNEKIRRADYIIKNNAGLNELKKEVETLYNDFLTLHRRGEMKKKYCLVLSGGGAKGAYHVGAIDALRELGVEIEAVVGNSVGAIVGGFVAQGNFEGLKIISQEMSLDKIVSIPEKLLENGKLSFDKDNLKNLREFRKDIFKKKGLDTKPLREILENNLDEDKIRKSDIDFGIITYSVGEFEPLEIFVENMKKDTVLRYIQASATLPGFKTTNINDKKFVDGGIHDNIPYSMAKSRGYKNIIVIDILGIGKNRKPNIEGTDTIYIKSSLKSKKGTKLLDFTTDFLKKITRLGYLDTKKVFGEYKGWDYFIIEDKKLSDNLQEILDSNVGKLISQYKEEDDKRDNRLILKDFFPEYCRNHREIIYILADCAAKMLDVDRMCEYNFDELIEEIRDRETEIYSQVEELKDKITKDGVMNYFKEILDFSKVDEEEREEKNHGCPYYYELVMHEVLGEWKEKLPFATLSKIYKELIPGKIFLELIKIKKNL